MMERTKNPIFPRLFSFPLEYDALWLQAVEDRYYIFFFCPNTLHCEHNIAQTNRDALFKFG